MSSIVVISRISIVASTVYPSVGNLMKSVALLWFMTSLDLVMGNISFYIVKGSLACNAPLEEVFFQQLLFLECILVFSTRPCSLSQEFPLSSGDLAAPFIFYLAQISTWQGSRWVLPSGLTGTSFCSLCIICTAPFLNDGFASKTPRFTKCFFFILQTPGSGHYQCFGSHTQNNYP